MGLIVKYVQAPNRSHKDYRYRRRIPADLRPFLGDRREFIVSLGRSEDDAVRQYAKVHALATKAFGDAKRQLKAKPGTADRTSTPLEDFREAIKTAREMGFTDVMDPPLSEHEGDFPDRELLADHIANQFPTDPETGYPQIDDPKAVALIRVLMAGARTAPPPTLEDAARLYIQEKVSGNAFEVRKVTSRIERIVARVKEALGDVPTLDRWTREEAKTVRDHFVARGLKPTSVRRELTSLSGIISHYIRETDAEFKNPVKGLALPANVLRPIDERLPLPEDLVGEISGKIAAGSNDDLRLIWELLKGTGCRIAEVTGLRCIDVDLDPDLPHLKIRPHEDRRLKTASSNREVPLVGEALEAARSALERAGDQHALFHRYLTPNGPTNASAILNKHIRKVTENRRHSVHSLRHRMTDLLNLAEVQKVHRDAILGHLTPGVGDAHYGNKITKLRVLMKEMRRALGAEEQPSTGD